MNERGYAILAAADRIAEKHKTTSAQISLAWLMAQPGVTAPISSGTSPQQVNELMQAIELKLPSEDLETLTNAGK